MTSLVEMIAKSLVDVPDKVKVSETGAADDSVITLEVAADDMGKVIGKQGRLAQALRMVVKAAAAKENKKVTVEIISDEEAGGQTSVE